MKTDMQPTPPINQEPVSIRDRVFSMIAEQQVEPRSKYLFLCQNALLWLLWLLTVLLGGLATAVLIFTSTYRYYDLYEAMHDNFITFFLEALPLLWVLMFVALMFVAVRGLRATKRGYRLSPLFVGGSSIGVSLLLGCLGSASGFGFVVDRALGEYAPMYYSQVEREQLMWQQPNEGRLVGHFAESTRPANDTVIFTDSLGQDWQMNIAELKVPDRLLLTSDQQVRVLGQELGGESARFHACGVFPWMLDKKRPMRELSSERKVSVAKMHAHLDVATDTAADQLYDLEQQAFGEARADNLPSMKICASIAAVRRISDRNQ